MQGGVRREHDLRNAPAAREPEADPDQASLIKTIQVNFDQLHVAAIQNRIFVYESATLKPIDILSDHKHPIRGLAVAQMLRNIVSFSRSPTGDETTFMVHCLVDSDQIRDQEEPSQTVFKPKTMQDEAVYMGRLKWQLTYTTQMSYRLPKSLAISTLGDFCVMGGSKFVSLWTVDALMDSYSQSFLWASAKSEDQHEAYEEELSLRGEVEQIEVCSSGRMFVSLEKGERTVKVWWNDDITLPAPATTDVDFRRFYQDSAPIQPYELPKHRLAVERFSFLPQKGSSLAVQPTVLLTVTKSKAFIWVESLEVAKMAFNCVKSLDMVHDASFIEIQMTVPRADKLIKPTDLRYDCSKLFHSYKDTEKHIKHKMISDNPYGIIPSALGGTKSQPVSLDWLLLLNEDHFVLVRCKGLRNVPSIELDVQKVRKIQLPADFNNSHVSALTLDRLLGAQLVNPGSYNDRFSLLTLDHRCTNVFKMSVDIGQSARQGGQADAVPTVAQLNASIRVNPKDKVTQMIEHPTLPLVALVFGETNLVQVYRLLEQIHPGVDEHSFSLHGSYHSGQASIIDAQWVPEMDQLLLLQEPGNQVALVSSTATTKMIARFGNRAALQEQVTSSLSQDPSILKLTSYRKLTQFDTFKPAPLQKTVESTKSIIALSSVVRVADQPHQSPSQTICFAAVGESGKCLSMQTSFQINTMDNSLTDQTQKILHQKPAFAKGFQLTKTLACKSSMGENGQASAHVLCLSQKKPEVQLQQANHRGPQKKPQAQLHLLQLSTKTGWKEVFVAPGIAEELLEQPVVAKISSTMLAVLIYQGTYNQEAPHLYFYSLENGVYTGYIDINRMLGKQVFREAIDFVFLEDKIKGAVALTLQDRMYVLYQKNQTWEVLPHSDALTNTHHNSKVKLTSILSAQTLDQVTLVSLQDQRVLVGHTERQVLALRAPEQRQQFLPRVERLHRMIIEKQRSQSLFHPGLLAELFFKGYGAFVVKILLKLKQVLEQGQSQKLTDYLDMDLESLLTELKQQVETLTLATSGNNPAQASAASSQPKKQTAFSVFDDLEESDSEEEKKEEVKDDEQDEADPKKLFIEGADDLAKLLAERQAVEAMGLDSDQARQLVTFVLKFKNIFQIDFYVDPLASMLLRRIFFETEKVDEGMLDQLQAQLQRNEQEAARQGANVNDVDDEEAKFMNYEVEEVKPFSMEEYMNLRGDRPEVKSEGDLGLVRDWTSSMVCQALHSENQEVVINFLADRFQFEKNLTWAVVRKLSIPIWLKDSSQLKKYIEFVAKTEYKVNEGRAAMCKADHAAIWYTLLGKKSVLQNLYSLENGHEKFAQFFQKDFTQEKTRTIATKNGMALVAKQKYHLACSFFLLAQKLDTAVQVALDRLHDPVLAILMCRITDPEGKTGQLDQLLQKWFIDRGAKFNDPYLMNIGFWLKKEFVKSVNQLAPDSEDSCIDYIYKNDVVEFDLLEKKSLDQESEDQKGAPAPSSAQETDKVYPLVSKRNYVILDLVKRLRKAPDVKRALNKAWANAKAPGKGNGGAGSIFDDFLGGGSDSSSEEVEEKKEEIEVDESQVLRQAIKQTLIQRQTVMGLLLIEENNTLRSKLDVKQVDRLSQTLLLDLVINIVETENSNQSIKHLRKGLSLLATQLNLPTTKSSEIFLSRQLKQLGLLKFRIEFIADTAASSKDDPAIVAQMEQLGVKVLEEQMQNYHSLVESISICSGLALNANDYELSTCQALLVCCESLETILNCMLILNCGQGQNDASSGGASRSLMQKQGSAASPSPVKGAQSRKFIGTGQPGMMNRGDNEVAAMDDSDEEEAKNVITQRLQQSPMPKTRTTRVEPKSPNEQEEIWEPNTDSSGKDQLANNVAAKFRANLALVLSLQSLVLLLSKYHLGKDLCEDLQLVLGVGLYADQLDSLAISEQQLESLKASLNLNEIKQKLSKIKGTLSRNIQHGLRPSHTVAEPSRRKKNRNIHKQQQCVYDFLDLWLRQMLVNRTSNLLLKSRLQTTKLLSSRILLPDQTNDSRYLQELIVSESDLSVYQKFQNGYQRLTQCLQDTMTYVFARVLTPVHQRLATCELEQVIEERYRCFGKSLNLAYYFSSLEKLRHFASSFEMHEKHRVLTDMQLSLTGQRSAQGQTDGSIQNNMLCTGIELFKQRQEAVVDICFDQTGSCDMMAMAIQAKGMREISVIDTLVFRNRREGGLEMIDEDQMSWSECLHRYDPIKQVHSDIDPKTDAVRAALYGLYYHSTATQTTKTQRPENSILVDVEESPARTWDGQAASKYLKTYSDLRITHDDYTNAVEAHPHLPIYLSGNAKGLVCMWSFNQMADKSLNQWVLDKDTPPSQANPKKSTVKRIAFNSYGDKFAALNTGGQLFMMNFDLETSSKVEPLYSTLMSPKLSEARLADFAFLDRDSIIAGVSLRDKVLNIYDTLLPPRTSIVQQYRESSGGNLLQVYGDARKILCFNSKPGYVVEYDMRKEGESVSNKLLAKEEITAAVISPAQDSLILGTSDGLVKIFDLHNHEGNAAAASSAQSEKGTISAFTNYGRKGAVSKLCFHPSSGALFAASNLGCVKLLRLAI